MRLLASFATVLSLVLAGCSDGGGGDAPIDPGADKASIRGLVVDDAIVPIPGASISIVGLAEGATTESDEAGEFRFDGLAPGDYLLSIVKPGYRGTQASATAVAGVEDPEFVRVLLARIATATPYVDHYKLEGYYECAFALFFITDSCDFGYRTAWDEANSTGNQPPAPRNLAGFRNTQYIDVAQDTFTIIQEGFWDAEQVPTFWVMIDETPIDNGCDCSDTYGNRIGPPPLMNRIERYDAAGGNNTEVNNDAGVDVASGGFPAGKTVASRGFIPFQESPAGSQDPNTWAATGRSFQFVVITSLFHNYVPDEAWTFETKDQFPVG